MQDIYKESMPTEDSRIKDWKPMRKNFSEIEMVNVYLDRKTEKLVNPVLNFK